LLAGFSFLPLEELYCSSVLYFAFCDAMSGSRDLTLSNLQGLLVPQHMTDVRALFCAHNLILMSMRAGIVPAKEPWRAFSKTNPTFFMQLYHPVYEKLPTQDAKQLAIKIAHHAEIKGLVRNAFDMEQSIVLNDKMEAKVTTIGAVIADIYERINGIEARVTNLESNARHVTSALLQVKANFALQKKMKRVGSVARMFCSFIPLGAGALAEAVAGSAEVMFGMCAEDIAVKATEFVSEKSVQVLTSVDISDPHLMQFIVSREYQNSLPPAVREAFARSVEAQFGNFALLERQLIQMIEEQGEKPLALATRASFLWEPAPRPKHLPALRK